jgi:hypothetical protein
MQEWNTFHQFSTHFLMLQFEIRPSLVWMFVCFGYKILLMEKILRGTIKYDFNEENGM